MEGGEGGMEGVREGVRWGDVCVRLLLARPVGRLTDRHHHPPPNASLPLPSIPSLGRSQPASPPSPLGLGVWAPGRWHLAKCFDLNEIV